MGSNKKSSMGACKSYCMNFDSFKIVDSSLRSEERRVGKECVP